MEVSQRCCAITPVVSAETADSHDLPTSSSIKHGYDPIYDDGSSPSGMVRSCEGLGSWLGEHNTVSEAVVLLTGTSLVSDDEFTLRTGDCVRPKLEGIGLSEDTVRKVRIRSTSDRVNTARVEVG